jgi:hypothetical protein
MKKLFAVLLASLILASLPLAMAGPDSGGGTVTPPNGGGASQGHVLDLDLSSELMVGDIDIRDVLSMPSGDLLFVGVQNGDSYIGGQFLESGGGSKNSFIGRFNLSTGLQWVRVLSSTCDNDIEYLQLTASGRVAFLGQLSGCPVKTNITIDNMTIESGGSALVLGSFNDQGAIQSVSSTTNFGVSSSPSGFSTDSYGNAYIAGTFIDSFSYSNLSFSGHSTRKAGFIYSLDSTGNPRWSHVLQSTEGGGVWGTEIHNIDTNADGLTLVTGQTCESRANEACTLELGEHELSNQDSNGEQTFFAAIDRFGEWTWIEGFGSNGIELISDSEAMTNSFILTGEYPAGSQLNGTTYSEMGMFILEIDGDGDHIWAEAHGESEAGTQSKFLSVESGKNGSFFVGGRIIGKVNPFGGSPVIGTTNYEAFIAGFNPQREWIWAAEIVGQTPPDMRLAWDNDGNISMSFEDELWIFSRDSDADGYGWLTDDLPHNPTQYSDIDGDGYGDNSLGIQADDCPTTRGNSHINEYGCKDFDKDGWSDNGDAFPHNRFSWNDTDEDGYADQGSVDDDVDDCIQDSGSSNEDRHGCLDSDGDGWSDAQEEWTTDDGADAFTDDDSQWEDYDRDGYGDNPNGWEPDACAKDFGSSDEDRFGCPDSDEDGWSDAGDDLSDDITQHLDVDRDGYGDDQSGENPDKFPTDNSQWSDEDGDGYGDNERGNNPDKFPEDQTQWFDSDNDGMGDNPGGNYPDAFVFNPTQWLDSDGDGWGDNTSGLQADAFPSDASQWMDIDGDGCGDNQNGTDPDAFPRDFSQCTDTDGDGWGDNLYGSRADLFPLNGSEWADEDGDGIGDNSDLYLSDYDNDGYNDSIDLLPMKANPGDFDNDGCLDEEDEFDDDAKECKDSDGDGEGDNADTDDDNDGWADTDELRMGTDPFSSKEQPVDSFEIVVPGTSIGLGAWDIMGMLGGIPLALWIGTGIVTRNGRTRRFEDRLFTARSEEELADISQAYEWSLMWRMIGPHQALRLERIRSNLEVKFSQVPKIVPDLDQTDMMDMMDSTTPESSLSGIVATDGYEWLAHGGYDWYREYSHEEWSRWQ